ncbi:MAG: MarR family transcriptional regulator [Pseudomonadota bacterium]
MPTKEHKTPGARLDAGELHELLGYLLAQASIATNENFRREVGKPLNLGKVEITILQLIKQNTSVTPSRLARALAISMPAVTVWIAKLEQRGLLLRQKNPNDFRSQHFCVTPEGDALVSKVITTLVHADTQTMKHMSPGERAMLFELLRKVARR